MDNLNLTPIQQERLETFDELLKMDMPEIIEQVAWVDAMCGLIEDHIRAHAKTIN